MEAASIPTSAALRPHQGRRLGDVLVDLGFCDRATVEAAVVEARSTGRPMGQLLLERHQVRGHQLGIAIAERFGLEFMSLSDREPDPAAFKLVPAAAMRRLDAVPIGFAADDVVLVAMADPRNLLAFDDLTLLIGRRVRAVVVTRADLEELLERVDRIESGAVADTEIDQKEADAELAESADDAPTVKLVRSIIADAIEQSASDVHFDPRNGGLTVRYRQDGIMRQATRVPPGMAAQVITRLKILSELDVSEHRALQDGRTTLTVGGRRVEIRVAIMPVVAGEAAILRILDPGDGPLSLGELGMDDCARSRVEAALRGAQGAVLSTGPTGSGKSMSLYASLALASSEEKTVMTIEDPVKYHVAEIKQMQVSERAGVSFASGLRAIMRADPDVILVGEIRDGESAKIAVEAALTGHIVLSSLPTNSAPAGPGRLVDMGVEPYLVASALNCVIAQRLARRLCDSCRRPLRIAASEVGGPQGEVVQIFEPVGCERCRGMGYRGRIGLFEVMTVSEEIAELISARASPHEIGRMAVGQGMRTLLQDGLAKVRSGDTSVDEVTRVLG